MFTILLFCYDATLKVCKMDKKKILYYSTSGVFILLILYFLLAFLTNNNGDCDDLNNIIDSLKIVIEQQDNENNEETARNDSILQTHKLLLDSLSSINTIDTIDSMVIISCMTKSGLLSEDSDSIIQKLQNNLSLLKKKYYKSNRKISNLKKFNKQCSSLTLELKNTIAILEKQLIKLQTEHSLAILFLLQNSLVYYPATDLQKNNLLDILIATQKRFRPSTSREKIKMRINRSQRNKYKGIKWAYKKASCPITTSESLLLAYGFNPKTVTEEQYQLFLRLLFAKTSTHLKYCEKSVKNIFWSDTKKRLQNITTCLKFRCGIK